MEHATLEAGEPTGRRRRVRSLVPFLLLKDRGVGLRRAQESGFPRFHKIVHGANELAVSHGGYRGGGPKLNRAGWSGKANLHFAWFAR